MSEVVETAGALVIRDATREDVAAMVALMADDHLGATRESVSDPPDEAYLAAFEAVRANPNDRLVVAEMDGRVIGCGQLTILQGLGRRGAKRALIEGVRIASAHRGTGLGAVMIGWMIERAREADCRLVQLTSDASRTRAHAFYARLGFKASHVGMKLELD